MSDLISQPDIYTDLALNIIKYVVLKSIDLTVYFSRFWLLTVSYWLTADHIRRIMENYRMQYI